MKKKFLFSLINVFFTLSSAYAQSNFTTNHFDCEVLNDSTVRISRKPVPYLITDNADSVFHIPSMVEHEGKVFKVREIAAKGFAGNADIRHLIIDEGIELIRQEAFICCVNLQSIQIPASVSYIETGVFGSCFNLRSFTVDSANEYFDSRGNCNAIIETGREMLIAACSQSRIPSSVTTIGVGAFAGCLNLEDITIPEGITHIEDLAFSDCENLKNISLPQSLEEIGSYAFWGCNSLSVIVIPENVKKIGFGLFRECNLLKTLVVESGNNVYDSREDCNAIIETRCDKLVAACANTNLIEGIREIEQEAFAGVSLCNLHIPRTVKRINSWAFADCNCLKSISVDEENPYYTSPVGSNAILTKDSSTLILGCENSIIPDNIIEIGAYAFSSNNVPAGSLRLPEGLKVIGEFAFSRCNNLWQIHIPSSVESIEENAFCGCPDLTIVQLKGGGKELKSSVFFDCKKLAVVELPEGITTIGYSTFAGCTNLYSVSIPSSLVEIKYGAFKDCPCEKEVLQMIKY